MSNKFYSNHDKVLRHGQSQIERYIEGIDKYEERGSMNALLRFREGADIVFRLGSIFDKEALISRLKAKLEEMNIDSEIYLTREDRSETCYLDHTRRIHAIGLVKNYIEFKENICH